jgi:hypothetical protein
MPNDAAPAPHRNLYARLRPSPGKGVGVFAIRDIPRGCNPFVGDDAGSTWVPAATVDAIADAEVRRMYLDFCPRLGDRYLAPPDFNRMSVSWYMNHSDEPNMVADANVDFRAARPILAGEELTADYRAYSDHAAGFVALWRTTEG